MRDQRTPHPRCATLQHVLDALTEMFAAGEIDETVLRQARSAILSYCRVAGKDPSKLKADIVELLDRADERSALMAGMLPRRWSNLKSMLRRALNLAGNPTKRARRDRPLSQSWDRMIRDCGRKDVQTRLRPFAGHCTDRGIEPSQVDEAVFLAYAEEVRQIARSRNPLDVIKKVRRCWNKLVDAFPAELSFRARTWTNPRRWALPLEAMPKSFQAEIALLRKARSQETYEEVFRCRPLKHDAAVDNFIAMIMRIVTVMHKRNGHPLSKISSLRQIVQPEHFEAIMRGLKHQTGAANLRQLGAYVSVMHWLAETWVKLGAGKLRRLKDLMAVVGRRKAEIADSSLDVLEQLDDPVKRDMVNQLAETVMAEFRAKGNAATKKDAEAFRNALFWELGLMTGWRPSSRARINMHDDIKWRGRKGREIVTLTAGKITEKTELRRVVEVPLGTSQMLRCFIDHARPLLRALNDDDNPYLFPGRRRGQHTSTGQLSSKSARLIALRTHVVGATGHKSRHVSVKLHLIENPGDWQTAQEHVGHRAPETTQSFYANITQLESSKRVQKSLGRR